MNSSPPQILFLCSSDHVSRERKGFAEALSTRSNWITLDRSYSTWGDIRASLEKSPDLVFHPDVQHTYLPEGLEDADVPTACLHIDTYSETDNRVRMSMLFDIALVCHPGYPEYFESCGHSETLLFPHAVRAPLYEGALPDETTDVAMVGRLDGEQYSYRRACVRAVQNLGVSTNDFSRYYEYDEMAELYQRAKIGLNVSRDDHLEDANLRCFEVMGGGALLMTPIPSELSEMGLVEGEHFVGYTSPADLSEKVKYYLDHEGEREEIARLGRKVTLNRFTYDRWAERLVDRIEEGIPRQAPARTMPEGEVASIYVDYFSKRGDIDGTLHHLRRQRRAGRAGWSLVKSIGKAAKATIRGWQRALTS